ncbi:Potassium transporter [Musa troglodytarum]|uniref:Potassium transporter n=1 Tax=Musa troglodytarum TaxID=320322 RepID=A0A9E7G7D6_9LILI|nr:Potassium transporter [Musa troglodytarum]
MYQWYLLPVFNPEALKHQDQQMPRPVVAGRYQSQVAKSNLLLSTTALPKDEQSSNKMEVIDPKKHRLLFSVSLYKLVG